MPQYLLVYATNQINIDLMEDMIQ